MTRAVLLLKLRWCPPHDPIINLKFIIIIFCVKVQQWCMRLWWTQFRGYNVNTIKYKNKATENITDIFWICQLLEKSRKEDRNSEGSRCVTNHPESAANRHTQANTLARLGPPRQLHRIKPFRCQLLPVEFSSCFKTKSQWIEEKVPLSPQP